MAMWNNQRVLRNFKDTIQAGVHSKTRETLQIEVTESKHTKDVRQEVWTDLAKVPTAIWQGMRTEARHLERNKCMCFKPFQAWGIKMSQRSWL